MQGFAALLKWANENRVRLTLKFIPDQTPSVFVVEAQVPKPKMGRNMYEFVRVRGKTVQDVSERFLGRVQ